ncbi:hypothetical protein [Sphingomicrobium clamense]|uniref:Uncharacterized protein n=1 Tax=Sphingomicrobium clamense TaxID=2851013 RepID=A0ABS6V6E8_9SPHN|nr:hypothetical protein [Sphingomicrobium sp. B8]MBW0145098.1 hypothetical protein [Sphingomicrobium sp. B8]
MPTNKTDLPEGTDKVISGASTTVVTTEEEIIVAEPTTREKAVAKIKEGGDTVAREAAGKARGIVGQGLERSSEAIANVSKLVGDTADGIDERIGPEYGDYARQASSYLSDTAQSLAAKDPDELIDDTRDFVRRSPGIALAGAAIVGFALARLIQSGLDAERRD